MKKIAFTILFIFAALPVFSQQEKEVQAFLERVCNEVKNTCNSQGNYEPLIEKYCSLVFRELYGETRRWEKKGNEAICGFNGAYDIFVHCQDYFEKIKFNVSDVQKIPDSSQDRYRATVTTHFYCSEYDIKEWSETDTVYIIRENYEWRIDDFAGGEYSIDDMMKYTPLIVDKNTDTQRIATRLKRIYKDVEMTANAGKCNTTPLYEKYCSKRFKDLFCEVSYWEEKLGEMIIGQDCWIRGQDWDKIVKHDISNVEITSPSKAVADVTATITLPATDSERAFTSKCRLDIVFENDEWVIDDFTAYNNEGKLFDSDSEIFRAGIEEAVRWWADSVKSGNLWWRKDKQ
ncbi:MAG: DUF3828 domain-containing protein [Bacteroidaceae bacterium]|nr:DUF3828 domain-containing protein [Bacteroidaceae bacterium]